jgi:hypothetical protein
MRLDFPELSEAWLKVALESLGYKVYKVFYNQLEARKQQIHITFTWVRHFNRAGRTFVFGHQDPLGLHLRSACIPTSPDLRVAVGQVLEAYYKLAEKRGAGALKR